MPKTSATLLIIDDDEVVRASLAAYLEDSGFSVLQASNGQQGLQVFEQDTPDLVICDLRMPQMGGLELIRQVTERSPQTPVIVVSGAGVMNDAVEALRLGAADYLIKPLEDLAVLEHSVRRALDRARLLDRGFDLGGSGAVGAYANTDPRVEESALRALGLDPEPFRRGQEDPRVAYYLQGAAAQKIARVCRAIWFGRCSVSTSRY